ncbi:hypothetical protein LO772_15970 [Yinghuangia sp. ASG 101]|uniref:hypothetical protein n=1 Tax=Yinghuangia sp. ASG 101 TaxID=2896848 RepID=UPI001E2B99D0|nr:hypothetical protein [Yinghuangia sp. ASG 101]UGQ14931.1 hypothetical protein LO772_15970 [Yinghuangia sp. ASG 101]
MKFRIVLSGACLCALGLTACGQGEGAGPTGGEGSPEAVAAVKGAAGVTVAAGSSRTKTTMTMQSGDRTVVLTGEGLFDYRNRIGTVSLQVPEDAETTGPLQEIVTPEALYMKNASADVPSDKWVRIDIKGLADGNLVSGGSTDPTTSFEILRGVNDDVSYVGTKDFGGTQVRHYKGTLDLRRAHDATPENLRAPLAAALKSFASATIPFEVYLDAEGRLRRVQEEFNLASGSGDKAGTQTAKVVSAAELYDFGVPVDVRPPAAEELYVAPTATPPAASPTSTARPSATKSKSPTASSASASATTHEP